EAQLARLARAQRRADVVLSPIAQLAPRGCPPCREGGRQPARLYRSRRSEHSTAFVDAPLGCATVAREDSRAGLSHRAVDPGIRFFVRTTTPASMATSPHRRRTA